MKRPNYLKISFVVALAVYGIVLARDVSERRFLDGVDLVAHEAGHLFFRWFGEFLMVTGGTIGQLFVPAAIMVYFYLRREFYSSAVALFWLGQNFFNISVYVKDAQAMVLPLVSIGGGEDTIHDWNYILLKFGLLRHDHAVASLIYGIGAVTIIAAVILAGYFSFDKEQTGP